MKQNDSYRVKNIHFQIVEKLRHVSFSVLEMRTFSKETTLNSIVELLPCRRQLSLGENEDNMFSV